MASGSLRERAGLASPQGASRSRQPDLFQRSLSAFMKTSESESLRRPGFRAAVKTERKVALPGGAGTWGRPLRQAGLGRGWLSRSGRTPGRGPETLGQIDCRAISESKRPFPQPEGSREVALSCWGRSSRGKQKGVKMLPLHVVGTGAVRFV